MEHRRIESVQQAQDSHIMTAEDRQAQVLIITDHGFSVI
jgi:hypothetical protein